MARSGSGASASAASRCRRASSRTTGRARPSRARFAGEVTGRHRSLRAPTVATGRPITPRKRRQELARSFSFRSDVLRPAAKRKNDPMQKNDLMQRARRHATQTTIERRPAPPPNVSRVACCIALQRPLQRSAGPLQGPEGVACRMSQSIATPIATLTLRRPVHWHRLKVGLRLWGRS
jgi:hypothetical protein